MIEVEELMGGRMERLIARHRNEIQKALQLIERSPRLVLLDRTASGDRMLVNFEAKTLRTVPGSGEPVLREFTPVEVLCPPIGIHRLSQCRVATELLPEGEFAFNCHILPTPQGIICTGTHWTPASFSLDLLIVSSHDILRGHNYLASPKDTFNPLAVPYYQRLRAEGKLPHDPRTVI
jgi:hypothetical protein